ncbi:hypothetical protein GCM10028827_40670 [Mucilaginibacter myungsuensis]
MSKEPIKYVKYDNVIIQMIMDKRRILEAIQNGQDLSNLEGIKIVSPIPAPLREQK